MGNTEGVIVATKVITVDDVDGYDGEDVAKREFEIGDRKFTLDLGDGNFKSLQELLASLAPYLEKASEVKQAGRARKSATDGASRLRGYTNTDVRTWAGQEGVEISVRGKIADEVYEKFIAAHPDAQPAD
jgi:Lsr2.